MFGGFFIIVLLHGKARDLQFVPGIVLRELRSGGQACQQPQKGKNGGK